MLWGKRNAKDFYGTAVGLNNLIQDADKGCFTGPIGAQQSINALFWYGKRNVLKGQMVGIALGNLAGKYSRGHVKGLYENCK
jgi:hypothetical protein